MYWRNRHLLSAGKPTEKEDVMAATKRRIRSSKKEQATYPFLSREEIKEKLGELFDARWSEHRGHLEFNRLYSPDERPRVSQPKRGHLLIIEVASDVQEVWPGKWLSPKVTVRGASFESGIHVFRMEFDEVTEITKSWRGGFAFTAQVRGDRCLRVRILPDAGVVDVFPNDLWRE